MRRGRVIVFHVDQGRSCSAGRSLVERLCDGCHRRADGWTEGYAGSVVGCVWEAVGRAGASIVKRLAMAAACGSQPVTATLPNLTGKRCARHPGIVFAIHRSQLTRRLAHLSLLPFPVPFRCRPAGRRLTSRYSILPRLLVWSVTAACLPPVPARLSPTTPPRVSATHGGPVRSQNTDGRAEVGGRPGTRRRCWSPGVRLHRKKGDAHDAAAVLGIVPGCN